MCFSCTPRRLACLLALLLAPGLNHVARAMPVRDFNADGIEDLLFRDRTRLDHRLAVVLGAPGLPAGGERRGLLLSTNLVRTEGFDVRTGDFDGDRRTDILDRDLASGRFRIRLMDGIRIRNTGYLDTVAPKAELQTVADFDGDGRDDLLLHDPVSGAFSVLGMRGLVPDPALSGEIPLERNPAWLMAASGDFNGDARTDLLLRNSATLAWRMLLLEGPHVLKSSSPTFLPAGTDWQLQSQADMNADGRADLLFRARSSGAWRTWYLAGDRALASSGTVSITQSSAWRMQLVDDLNGDNMPDAALARFDTGDWRIEFLVQGTRIAGSGVVAREPLPQERIAASGDYDGDGARELLVSTPEGWQVFDVANPAAPLARPLDVPLPQQWSLACEPPRYAQFGKAPKPTDAGSDSAFLTWTLPTTRENGEPLCDHELAGYQIQYNLQRERAKIRTIGIKDPSKDNRLITALDPGTWVFRIRALDTRGFLSASSTALVKTVP